jgi:hypothetical protein
VSALYRLPRPALGSYPPPALDGCFVTQLRALCREDMWGVFRSQTADMEAHVAEVKGQCAALAECLEPVYRYTLKLSDRAFMVSATKFNSICHITYV